MRVKRKFKSNAFESVHRSANALLNIGAIDKTTMRQFDDTCLHTLHVFAPVDIKRIREANNVSQPVFARYLNTSESTIQEWKAGTKHPSGMALKLLNFVEKHGLGMLA